MKRAFLLIAFLLLPSLNAVAQESMPPVPDAMAERAGVAEAGPQLVGDQPGAMREFVGAVIQDTNVMWSTLFEASGMTYVPPTWVLVDEGNYSRSNCGINAGNPADNDILNPAFYCIYGGELGSQVVASSVVQPTQVVYTPVVYLSVPWLSSHFSTRVLDVGVAVAYLIAHESGHHVQRQLGYMDHTGGGCCDIPDEQLELMTDCLAGVWAFSAYDVGTLDEGDIEQAQSAAWGPGSDKSTEFGREGEHGTREQQIEAFMLGYESGTPGMCFSMEELA